MIASLYHSDCTGSVTASERPLEEIIEVVFGAHAPAHAKNVSGHFLWIELHVIVRALPEVAILGDQIVHLIFLMRFQLKIVQRKIKPAGLPVMGIEVDDDHDDVRTILAHFAVGNDLIVVHGMKPESDVALQSSVVLADSIDLRDQSFQAVGTLDVPDAYLVLLRVEILLASGMQRAILKQFERGSVNSIVRPKRRREHEAHNERRAAAVLQIFGENVRS